MICDYLVEFQDYLVKNRITDEKHSPYWAYWVKSYLNSVDNIDNIENINNKQTLIDFISNLNKNENIKDWQLIQAKSAIEAYLSYSKTDNSSTNNIDVTQPTAIINAVKSAIRIRHYSYSTEKTYIDWIKRFNKYIHLNHNTSLDKCSIDVALVKRYLEWLAIKQKVSASTQNQAFNSLLFLMKNVLKVNTDGFDKTIRAKKTKKLPVVLSIEEIRIILDSTPDKSKLYIELLYGTGIRLSELTSLRIKDIDFDNSTIIIRSGKGNKDRSVPLPQRLRKTLKDQVIKTKQLHDQDLRNGYGEVNLPNALAKKYKDAGYCFNWQYLFPSHKLSVDPRSGKVMRYHISNEYVQKAVKTASSNANIIKHVTVHTLRHSFATHLLQSGVNIREIQDLLGHKNLETTMIYTHVLRNMSNAPASPLDTLYSI